MYSLLLHVFSFNTWPAARLLRTGLIFLTLFCFAKHCAVAVTPPPDGGYPNQNTAEGNDALLNLNINSVGGNTAIGSAALKNDTTGTENTALGTDALRRNTDGNFNTAVGFAALSDHQTGDSNTAIGWAALSDNTGNNNTAAGLGALFNNHGGGSNTAVGLEALQSNTSGSNNVALGANAGSNLTTGSNNIDIGENVNGLAGEADTIRIGKSGTQTKTVIAGIRGATVASGVGVIVGTTGQLGTVVSSARFKEAIKPMDKASEAILALKPVSFRYKEELDPDHVPQFGLVAEEVEKVDPDLVARDEDGKVVTVRYEAVNAMLLNEFLKEHRRVGEQEATIAQLKSTVANQERSGAQQQKEIKALAATLGKQASQIQKVSAQLELKKPTPQTVVNNQ